MKLQVTQENLSHALNNVCRIANTRGTLPILSNVLLKTTGNRLSVAATNLDIAITQYIGSKVSEDGMITVPARLTQDFVSSLPSGVIDLELDDHKLSIKADKYQSIINGISADDFPVMPVIIDGKTWSIPASTLKLGLQQVVPAASSDETRPVLTGVYFHSNNGWLYMVATDGYRLAEKKLLKTKEDISLLIPASSLQDLLRILSDSNDNIEVTYDDQQVLFKVDETELITRLIDGKYPDYRKLVPSEFKSSAKLQRTDMVNITKVSSLFARESAGSVTIQLDADKSQVSIRSIASQLGENTSVANADITGGGTITLNSRYIIDALHALNGDEVTFSFNGKLEPTALVDPKTKDYLHIIMPLKS